MRHKSTYIPCIHNKDFVQFINIHAITKWSQQIYFLTHSLQQIIIQHTTYQLYLYLYDPLSLFFTHATYLPHHPNHHHITTK
jgi:hypothetical protein